MAATYTAKEFAELLGVSLWALYQSVGRGDCPVPPIPVGRRYVWPKAAVDRLLGLGVEEEFIGGPRQEMPAGARENVALLGAK
jgi:predicted DNA-binding transcriptional regulator AlpA